MTVTETELEPQVEPEVLPVATLDDIFAAPDTAPSELDVPEWGVRVVVRGFTRKEALQWSECDSPAEGEAFVLHYGMVDPAVTLEQAREILASKSQVATTRILREVMRLSGTGIRFQDQEPGR